MGLKERNWVLKSWPVILREIAYHKEHKDIEALPYIVIKHEEEEA
jgi:hypothetical protein